MRKTITAICLGLMLIIASAAIAGGAPSQPAASPAAHKDAISLVRLLNTAEYQYRHTAGRFGTFDELANAGLLQAKGPAWDFAGLDVHDAQSPIPGFELRLTPAAGGAHYQVSVIDSKGSGWGAFSDDRGLIYQGKVLR